MNSNSFIIHTIFIHCSTLCRRMKYFCRQSSRPAAWILAISGQPKCTFIQRAVPIKYPLKPIDNPPRFRLVLGLALVSAFQPLFPAPAWFMIPLHRCMLFRSLPVSPLRLRLRAQNPISLNITVLQAISIQFMMYS